MNTMLKSSQYVFWILIFYSCDGSTILAAATPPVQTIMGWNASFNMQLDPYPSIDSVITIRKNGVVIMRVKGTVAQGVAERFEFTGNTFENRISFILRNVTLGDAGTYNATETGLSSGGEQILIVKVAPSKPQIIALTSSVLGSDYRLTCSSVSNSVPPDHGLTMMSEWKVNDQLIMTGGRFQVQGTQLTITSLIRQDNSIKLTCVAYEDLLVKSVPSNELVIDVKYGPGNSVNLGSNPSTLIVYLHQRAQEITCNATCNPQCDYRWYHNGTLYSSGATLSLGLVESKTSAGNYTCEAYNRFLGLDRSSSTSVSINIYYGAKIVTLSVQDSNTVNEKSSAIFQCQVDSNPLPTTTWRKEGTNTVLKTESGVVQSQFRIESAQCQDTDNYTCSAYNGVGTKANETLQLFVKCHPRTDSEVPPEIKVYKSRHAAAFLRYTVISYPLPKFTWMFFGNGSESKDLPGSASPYVSGRQSELRFSSLNIDDFGYYSVVADNSLPPSAREVFQIIPADVPEVPSNITITEVTENSITVQWVAGYNGGTKQTFYVFASADDITRNFTTSDPGYGNIGTVVIKGLAASTRYSIYMSASNVVGTSSMTEAIFIITLEELPSPVVRDFPVAAVSGGVVGGILLVIVIVVVAVVMKKRTLKPKLEESRKSVVFEGKGPEYVNAAFGSDINTTEYEALQSGQTESSQYEALNDLKSKLDSSNDIRISSDPRPSTGEMSYDKLQSNDPNQGHLYSCLSSPRLDEDKNKFYENTVIVNQILP